VDPRPRAVRRQDRHRGGDLQHVTAGELKDLAADIDRPLLLIAAPNAPTGEKLNRGYRAAAGESATLWEIPEADHMGGQTARPAEYERRVIGFFDSALAP
jgi:hypothetical protein